MAVDLMRHSKMDDQIAIQDAAADGLRSMEQLIRQLSHQHQQPDCREVTEAAVSKFKKVISILNRTGHARFRRGPACSPPPPPPPLPQPQPPADPSLLAAAKTLTLAPVPLRVKHPNQPLPPPRRSLTLDFSDPAVVGEVSPPSHYSKEGFSISTPISSAATSSFMSSVTGDGSVSNGIRLGGSSLLPPPPTSLSAGKPPLSSSLKRRCHEHEHGHSRCHCSKRRKSRVKRTIRVPAISSKVADIPQDEYSWRKYGQKPIKGSPYPRGYYKCSTLRGCPARKHVERALDDPTMLIVTYEAEHRHNLNAVAVMPELMAVAD